jgi:hypothetical protein
MKHLKKFEDLDYKELLAQQSKLRDELEKSRLEEIEKRRQELSGKHLSKISSDVEKRSQMDKVLAERQELTHLVIQSLIFSEQNKDGFDNFKNDLRELLDKYPLDKLPRSGSSIYR